MIPEYSILSIDNFRYAIKLSSTLFNHVFAQTMGHDDTINECRVQNRSVRIKNPRLLEITAYNILLFLTDDHGNYYDVIGYFNKRNIVEKRAEEIQGYPRCFRMLSFCLKRFCDKQYSSYRYQSIYEDVLSRPAHNGYDRYKDQRVYKMIVFKICLKTVVIVAGANV